MRIKPANRLNALNEYYFSEKLAQLERMRAKGIDVINLGIGNPDLPPDTEAIEVLQTESALSGNHGYQSYKGIPQLREALSDWYGKWFGVSLNPDDEVLPLMGSKEGIMHISMAFLNPGDEVLVANPAYPAYAAAAKLSGAAVRYYPLKRENDFFPDLDTLEKSDLSKVKLMWVNYPNMPTGKSAGFSLFKNLVSFGKKHNILIVNDNPYGLILTEKPESILKADPGKEIALELNSLSKSHNMAGWRIGMAAGNRQYIKAILNVKSNMDSGMFKPLQLAAAKALKNSENQIRQINRVYKHRQQLAYNLLDKLGCSFQTDGAGLFIWAQIPGSFAGSREFSQWLLDKTAVFITPGFIFGSEGERYIRLSLSNSEEKIKQAISRVSKITEIDIKKQTLKQAI